MLDLFSTLPKELLDKILCHYSKQDLAEFRCVSPHCRKLAEPLLFRKLTLLPTPQSTRNVASIMSSKHLRSYVQEFCFSAQTSLETLDVPSLYLPSFKDPRYTNQTSSPLSKLAPMLYQRKP